MVFVSCTAATADSLTTGVEVEGVVVESGGVAAAAVSSVVMLTACCLSARARAATLGRAMEVAGRPARGRAPVSQQPLTAKAIAAVERTGAAASELSCAWKEDVVGGDDRWHCTSCFVHTSATATQ